MTDVKPSQHRSRARSTPRRPRASPTPTSTRSPPTTSRRRSRCGSRAAARTCAARSTRPRPTACATFLTGIIGPFPDFVFEVVEKTVQDDRAAVPLGGAAARSPGTPFQGVEPNGARLDLEGIDVLIVRDGADRREQRLRRRHDRRAPARPDAAGGLAGRSSAMKRAFNAKTKAGDEARLERPGPDRRRRLARARRLPGQDDERLPRPGRRRRDAVRRRRAGR